MLSDAGGTHDVTAGWRIATYGRGGRIRDIEDAPPVCDLGVDREHAVAECRGNAEEPLFQRAAGRRVAASDGLDAATDLAEHQHAREQVLVPGRFEPAAEARMSAIALAELGEDVRVEEPAHAMSRGISRGMAKSASSPTSGIETRTALNEARSLTARRGSGS